MAMHPGTDMERVRHVLARELETISEYEQLSREAEDPRVREFLAHLAAEEKEHVTEAVMVLRQLDPTQDEYFTRGVADGHFTEGTHAAVTPPVPTPRPAPAAAPRALTLIGAHDEAPPLLATHAVHAVPAPPSDVAIPFTVGSLRPTR